MRDGRHARAEDGPPLLPLALVSAAALACEILLTRLFSIIQWHHFAYMMISVAMLGYGVSGMLLTVWRSHLLAHYQAWFIGCAAAFGVGAVVAFALAQRLPFNAPEILWDARQPLYLLLMYLLLAIPFVFAAGCIGLTLARYGTNAYRVYSYDLCGAACGCLLVVALLWLLPPLRALLAVGLLGLVAVALAAWQWRRLRWLPWLAGLVLAAALAPASWSELRLSPYKALSQALRVPGAAVVAERSSPLGLISVVASPQLPLRHAPGLSLHATQEPPPQLAVYTDGNGPFAISRFDGDLAPFAYLDQTTSALPYHLLRAPHVLVLGAGSGSGVLQALAQEAPRVDAVELDARLAGLVRERFAAYSGDLYRRPGVTLHIAEARAFAAASRERYDLIQVELLDAFGAAAGGVYGMSENYLYTVEALQTYLDRLQPGGLLALTRWVTVPPRDLLKLAATAAVALERAGEAEPGRRLALIRGWQTGTLLVKNGEFDAAERAAIRAFAEARGFDVEWLPGLARVESNRFHVLDRPDYYDGMAALSGAGRADYLRRYKFELTPASDDRPYFFHFFRWRALPEILSLKARGGLPLLELGYPLLLATLAQAFLASAALILLPLWLALRREPAFARSRGKPAVLGYFALIGLAFILMEISFIQKFTLYLGHPLYAVALGIGAFLLFAGLGSRAAPRFAARWPRWPAAALPVAGIALLVLAYLAAAPWLPLAMALPEALRVLVVVALIAPLAWLMGMPFPLALERLAARAPSLLPWAWGINACATVVGAALAVLLALHGGFRVVALIALALYAAAALLYARLGQA